jgi:PAS domain S-box-containing protein
MLACYDTDLRVIWANRVAGDSVGMSHEELVGRHCYEIWHQRDEPCEDCPVLKARDDKAPREGEVQSPDGRHWHLRGYPVLEDGGKVVALVEFGQEITERKRAEEEKARLEQQYRQSQKMESIGRLAGGVAHDLNNLLSPILGYSEMLTEDAGWLGPRRKPLEEIASAGRRARDLVGQLLAVSRGQKLEFQSVDLNSLLMDFSRLLNRTIREDIKIEMSLAPTLPPIKGDVGQIEQVIMNLAVNAQDAMPDGGELTFETAQVELDESYAAGREGITPGPYVMLVVSDTGHGMNAETREHLFEPFFSTKEKQRGTGLGSAIVYGIVRQHGGTIWVYSEPDKGTTFKIYFPVTTECHEDEKQDESATPNPAGGTETILVVEDNEHVRNLAVFILEQNGYHVVSAENGQEALAKLGQSDRAVDLLLTDVVMPGINGVQLLEQVLRLHPNIKVLFMSGYPENVVAHRGVIDEGVQFIQKPFSVRALVSKVRKILDSSINDRDPRLDT